MFNSSKQFWNIKKNMKLTIKKTALFSIIVISFFISSCEDIFSKKKEQASCRSVEQQVPELIKKLITNQTIQLMNTDNSLNNEQLNIVRATVKNLDTNMLKGPLSSHDNTQSHMECVAPVNIYIPTYLQEEVNKSQEKTIIDLASNYNVQFSDEDIYYDVVYYINVDDDNVIVQIEEQEAAYQFIAQILKVAIINEK